MQHSDHLTSASGKDLPGALPEEPTAAERAAIRLGYLRGYKDALHHAAFYVYDHCQQGEYHAECIAGLKIPDALGLSSRSAEAE
jgi:hypothetical protein